MASVSFLVRSTAVRHVVRRSMDQLGMIRLNATSASQQLGSIRWSSYFTPAHEYVKVDGKIGTCGITDYAQSALGDIVFVDLPEVGETFDKGDAFGSVESVKAASDVYAPVSGKVVAINEKLSDEPALVNNEAEGDAWFIKLELTNESELADLMGPDAYKEHIAKELH